MPEDRPKVSLTVVNGAMLQAPVYERGGKASNWAAVIDVDPSKPGGLSRQFLERGRGECLYLVDQLGLFDAVEFAADQVKADGSKRRNRWFGVVVAKSEDLLIIEQHQSGATAVLNGKTKRGDRKAVIDAMEEQLASIQKA